MSRVEVEAALRAWREAAHEVESLPSGSSERTDAEFREEERRLVYQRAVLGGRGRADALAAASEGSLDRLHRSRHLIERGHELTGLHGPAPDGASAGPASPASDPQADSSDPTSRG